MRHPSSMKLFAAVLLAGGACVAPLRGLDLSLFAPDPESYFDASVLQGDVLENTANVESGLVAALDPETLRLPLLSIRVSARLSEGDSVFVTLGDFLRIECDGRWRVWAGDKMETLRDASRWTQATATLRGPNASLLAFDVRTVIDPTRILVR